MLSPSFLSISTATTMAVCKNKVLILVFLSFLISLAPALASTNFDPDERFQELVSTLEQKNENNNSYIFGPESFEEISTSSEGNVKMLKNFSGPLRGLENYRLTLLEANPQAFVMPTHYDAEAVVFVLRGKGIINLVQEEKRESYNLESGDVIRVQAGTIVYLINRDNTEKLNIAKLFRTLSTPGQYQAYYSVGGEDPESYFRVFSDDILQAAFNTPTEKLKKFFGQQNKGVMVKASEEQIKALSQNAIEGGPEGGPYKLLRNIKYRSVFGVQHRVNPTEYKQLQEIDMSVSLTNINKGAMTTLFYNSGETAVVLVVEGRGRFEMANQIKSQGESGGRRRYEKISSELSAQMVFVIPRDHPTIIVASDEENLLIMTFDINTSNNVRGYLAGKNNILKQLDTIAKELSFNMEATEVDSIFNNQENMFFLPGPTEGRKDNEHVYPPKA